METTINKLAEAQKEEIQFQAKLKTLDLEQDKLNVYAWMALGVLIVAVGYLFTL